MRFGIAQINSTRGRSGCSENARLSPEADLFDANGDRFPEQATLIRSMTTLVMECGEENVCDILVRSQGGQINQGACTNTAKTLQAKAA